MYKKNDKVELEIIDMTIEGFGISKLDDSVFFVKNAIIGDVVEAIITKNSSLTNKKNNIIYAKVVKILKLSNFRVDVKCEVCESCGGCQIMSLDYKKQLELKLNIVKNNLLRIGKFKDNFINEKVEGIVECKKTTHFRNKMQIPFGYRNGKIITGFYANRTHYIIENNNCVVGFDEAKVIIDIIKKICRKNLRNFDVQIEKICEEKNNNLQKYISISVYDEMSGNGLLREVMLRKGNKSNDISLTLIVNDEELSNYDKNNKNQFKEIMDFYNNISNYIIYEYNKNECSKKSNLKTITLNVNTEKNNVLFGKKNIILYGSGYIEDELCGMKFNISPQSFYQVNNVQTEVLYNTVVEFLKNVDDIKNAIDLYCGIGTITLLLSKIVKQIVGIEIVEEAIKNAKINAEINNIKNVEFICSDANNLNKITKLFETTKMESFEVSINKKEVNEKYEKKDNIFNNCDLISVDPPRKGLEIITIEYIKKISPKYILYVSCDSATLSRDLKILCDSESNVQYKIDRIKMVDMFPHTMHVETVVLMSKDGTK